MDTSGECQRKEYPEKFGNAAHLGEENKTLVMVQEDVYLYCCVVNVSFVTFTDFSFDM